MEALDAALARDIAANLADPSLRPRSLALLAATQFDHGEIALALASATRAIHENPTSRAASRAALTWIAAALKSDDAITLPPALSNTIRAYPELQRVCRDAIETGFPTIESAVARMQLTEVGAAHAPATSELGVDARRVILLASALQAATSTLAATLSAKNALALLVSGAAESAAICARDAFEHTREDRFVAWVAGEVLCASSLAKDRAEGFAILRDLAPMGESARDAYWWRAQARLLEVLVREADSGDVRRASDVVARVNRLRTLDSEFGGDPTSQRIERVRDRAEALLKANASSAKNGVSNGG